MHHISFSSGSSSFNYTTPVQEAQNRFASAPANSPPPATTTSIVQASEGLQRPVAMPSMQAQLLRQLEVSPSHPSRQEGVQHSATTSSPTFSSAELDTMLVKAVDAQRLDINTQAGPSNSLHLNALNKLQQRNFRPAAGGIEIPFTPNSLLGGSGNKRKRVDHFGSTSSHIQVNLDAAIKDSQLTYDAKKQLITNLKAAFENETDPRQRVLNEVRLLEEELSLHRLGDSLEQLLQQHIADLTRRNLALRDR